VLRAIVFDFDGVIANSEPLHFAAFRDILAEEGIPFTRREYYDAYLGYDDRQLFRTLADDRKLKWTAPDIEGLAGRKAARMEALEQDHSILFPGAAEKIREAAAAVPVAIASGALGVEVRRVLERERLTGCFAAIVAAEDTPASKPAPDPYLRALALLRAGLHGTLDAGECVAIEDSHWGLQSAQTAGMKTVGVTSSYSATDLASADLVISSLGDLDLHALAALCQ
jgi:beta-phosphoglucomutase-like phosphatase (HAD superfamily)